jgi:hypothetical protein
VSSVPVEATTPSINWHITGAALDAVPSNDTPQPNKPTAVVVGIPNCNTVFVVAPASATTVGSHVVAAARGLIMYSLTRASLHRA